MNNEVIFGTQIGSIVLFLGALFGIYRTLVAQKDAVIQLLKERITVQEQKIRDLESHTPDALATALSARIEVALKEIERLKEDGGKHQDEIKQKEYNLQRLKWQRDELLSVIRENDLACHHCGSPLIRRDYCPITGFSDGHEVDAVVECIDYECGLSTRDGKEISSCKYLHED